MNRESLDRWLTTEPAGICYHAGSACADPTCDCDCEHCEQFKANYIDDSTQFTVITVCGSMRFADIMLRAARELTAKGYIVIMPFVAEYAGAKEPDDTKRMLDFMHRRKIDMSERILVVTDESEYIGESTRNEIAYARECGKAVDWYRTNRHVREAEVSA